MTKRTLAVASFALLLSVGGLASAQDHGLDGTDIQPVHPQSRTSLGMRVVDITPELREHFGAPRLFGVLVARVEPHTMASKAGVRVGDVITRVDTAGVASGAMLGALIRSHRPGSRVAIELVRDKHIWRLSAVVPKWTAPPVKERSRFRYRWPSDLLDPWTNTPIPPDPWDTRFASPLEQRVRKLERRMREMEERLEPTQ